MKRIFDISVSTVLLVILLLPILILSLMVLVKLGPPVLFSQYRPGYKSRIFRMYKFRTMTNGRDVNGNLLPKEMRMTRFGKLIRDLSLDELPALFNVIKGDMSLVGPRPLRVEYLSLYSPEQARRHDVKPGITGWAQVNGRNSISWEEKFKLDVWYVENHSFLLDMKILFLTIIKALKKEGVNQNESTTMEPFKGIKLNG